jgi:dihydroorotate dehydrogenase
VAAVAAGVGIAVVGMGGVQSGTHARALIDVGATLVAVGTENFCDPVAGARIARELAETAPRSQSPAERKMPRRDLAQGR